MFVPVDPSDHGANATAQAIALARSHGARISFRYAQAAGARGRREPAEALVRADAAARAQGLTSTAASIVAEQPGARLLAAADQAGCDAVVLAHGTGQLAEPSSAARHVLVHARIPVLSIGANCVPTPIAAIDLLHNEYRRLTRAAACLAEPHRNAAPAGRASASAPLLGGHRVRSLGGPSAAAAQGRSRYSAAWAGAGQAMRGTGRVDPASTCVNRACWMSLPR
ncbi:universal stress protein [Cupriavidus basilensis]